MSREVKAYIELKSAASQVETLPTRQAALDRYCQLFARGLFPVMVEEGCGTCRVFLSPTNKEMPGKPQPEVKARPSRQLATPG